MDVRGAGIIPCASYGGEEYLLLGEQGCTINREWGDLGGKRDPGESVHATAAREAHEESRGVLGSTLGLIFRTFWPMETIALRQYRSYLCRWRISNLCDIPKRFQRTHRHGHVFNEMNQLQWVKASEVHDAAMNYRPGSGKCVCTAAGKRLARRCTGVLRRSSGYARHAASQVDRISTSTGHALINLKNGRAFLVEQRGSSSDNLILKRHTGPQSLWQRIKDFCLVLLFLKPNEASSAEREAIFHALQQESLVHRLYRRVERFV